ncbi:MAG: electron transfer flavoprotein subunit alpha/FixB family protein [Desulfobacterales bacterium]|nr:electron transfer flavoprotein subunit alpha/FixB family protein [Desulfobacterales bacterium]
MKILLIADTINDNLIPSYKDLLGVSNLFSQSIDLTAVLIIPSGKPLPKEILDEINMTNLNSIDIINLINPIFNHPHPLLFADTLKRFIRDLKPEIICFPHTMRGCQMAANLSISCSINSITAVESVIYQNNKFLFQRSLMNGKWIATVRPQTDSYILTLNSGAFANITSDNNTNTINKLGIEEIFQTSDTYISLNVQPSIKHDKALEEAEVIVSAGRGIAKKENIDLIRKTISIFKNAALGASRPLCDLGWFPYSHQVGETGRQVAPKLYLACGISGAQQHINGMRGSQCIIAINIDPQSAIFSIADYGIIEKIEKFLPILIEKIHRD